MLTANTVTVTATLKERDVCMDVRWDGQVMTARIHVTCTGVWIVTLIHVPSALKVTMVTNVNTLAIRTVFLRGVTETETASMDVKRVGWVISALIKTVHLLTVNYVLLTMMMNCIACVASLDGTLIVSFVRFVVLGVKSKKVH